MKVEDVAQSLLEICFYGVYTFDPHLPTHQSNVGVR